MKKYILLTLLIALGLPGYGRTPKEYFESGKQDIEVFEEDFREIQESKDWDEYERLLDSCFNEVRQYVYNDYLPTFAPNTLEQADALLRWAAFGSYYMPREEMRALAQRIRSIVLPLEGKKERYIRALDYEINSWYDETLFDKVPQPLGADSAQTINALFEERMDCFRLTTRPTDSAYFESTERQAVLLCRTKYLDEFIAEEEEFEGYYYDEEAKFRRIQYHRFALLWRDLLKWNSITKEEYRYLYDSLVFSYDYYNSNTPTYWPEASYYYSGISLPDYADAMRAHAQITKCLYGMKSSEYVAAAGLCVEALEEAAHEYTKQHEGARDTMLYMEQALAVCNELLKSGYLSTDSAYYAWQIDALRCRLNIEGPTPKLGKQINQATKEVRARKKGSIFLTILYDSYLTAQVEHALLAKDYARAIQVQQERWEQQPPLPNTDDPNYWLVAGNTEAYARLFLRTYVLKGDFKAAFEYFKIYAQIIPGETYSYPENKEEAQNIAEVMIDYCGFPEHIVYPYYWHLQQSFIAQLQNWCNSFPE